MKFLHTLLFFLISSITGLAEVAPASLQEAVDQLNFPKVKVNIERRSVDIEAVVALNNGMLELIACKAGSKEHESIVSTEAKPSHIHTALLLLGAKAGNPAHGELISKEPLKWRHIPPSGDEVDLYLVIKRDGKEREMGIQKFIKRFQRKPSDTPVDLTFPTNTFLFAGSKLIEREGKKPQYVCDSTGNIISIATFGDELLCLPDIHDHANASLVWEVNDKDLPPLGEKVTLRLVPRKS